MMKTSFSFLNQKSSTVFHGKMSRTLNNLLHSCVLVSHIHVLLIGISQSFDTETFLIEAVLDHLTNRYYILYAINHSLQSRILHAINRSLKQSLTLTLLQIKIKFHDIDLPISTNRQFWHIALVKKQRLSVSTEHFLSVLHPVIVQRQHPSELFEYNVQHYHEQKLNLFHSI